MNFRWHVLFSKPCLHRIFMETVDINEKHQSLFILKMFNGVNAKTSRFPETLNS